MDYGLTGNYSGPEVWALALDETDVEAHVALAIESQWYEWDWAASEKEFKRAIELNPDSGDALGYYSWFLPPMGRNDEAVAEAERGLRIDPISTGLNGNLGSVLVFAHQWDKAIEQLRAAIDLDHGYWFDYCFLGRAYEQKGRFPEAIATFQRGLTLEGNTELWSGLGHAYAASGNKAEAQKVLDHLNDEAFAWLNRAYEERSSHWRNTLRPTHVWILSTPTRVLPNWCVKSVCRNS